MPFANTEEDTEWTRLVQEEVLTTQESTMGHQDTHLIIETVEQDIEFIKEGTIPLINHHDSFLLFLDKQAYEYVWISIWLRKQL